MNIFKKSLCVALGALALCGGKAGAQDSAEEPAVTFRTNIYDTYGDTNSFHIVLGATEPTYFDIDYGFGPEEVYVDVAYFDQDSQAMKGTAIQCRVSSEGIVRIYGDASKLDYFDAEGCYIDWIDMDRCTNLEIIDLQHNELKRLDLTPFTKAAAIYLSDNTFTPETPLIVGPNKPNLMILEIDITEYIDESFNLSDYPAMVSFDAYHCRGLRNIDPSGCPNLQVLSLELTDVAAVDVSQNTNLTSLNISDTRVTTVDLSRNANLLTFLAEHSSGTINTDVRLQSIDLSHNPNLVIVSLGGNGLTGIDLSHNPLITNLNLKYNNLSTINLDANTSLYSVNLTYNDLTYATLPLPGAEWGEYYYFRDPLPCERSYAVGSVLDLSESVLREGTTTTVKMWRAPIAQEVVEVDESAYQYADGKVTFNQAFTDSVYVEYINSAFPDYTLRSGSFMVKSAADFGKPSPIVTFRPSSVAGDVKFGVSLYGASAASPRTIHVKAGDSEELTFAVTSADPASPTTITLNAAEASKDVVIGIEESDVLTSLVISDQPLASLDVTAATELRRLSVTDCSLRSIDLQYNRCLETLDLSGNRLGNLSLLAPSGGYEKYVLREIKAERNQIYNFEIASNRQVKTLDLSDNRLTALNLTNYNDLRDLDLSNNRIEGIMSLTYLASAETIDLHNNSIDSLTIDAMPALKTFNVASNKLSIRTLPLASAFPAGCDYTYAPQALWYIVDKAPGINLTAQNRVIDGAGTTFVWKKADGTLLLQGVDMECTDGATRFLNTELGEVYCEMTNPAFPDLSGDNAFRTTNTLVVGAPSTVIASFKCAGATDQANVIFRAKAPTAVYIDWRGDGTEYLQYEVPADAYRSFTDQIAYAGAEAKVYTYGSADELTVFSIYNVPMTSIDASPMTSLTSFSVGGAGLDEDGIVFPASPDIRELNLEDNNLSSMSFDSFTRLRMLNLGSNNYESFDATGLPGIEVLVLNRNKISDLKFNNPVLWGLAITDNGMEEVNLAGLTALQELAISGNNLSTIDLSPVASTIKVLDITNNRFTFATLPDTTGLPELTKFYYGTQAMLDVECIDGKVDLSSQATAAGVATQFYWYLGEVYIDTDTGEVVGEALDGDSDDPEYTVDGGVTSFHYTFSDKVTGLLLNEAYPNLALFTNPVTVDTSTGITEAAADLDPDTLVDVFTPAGICVRRGVRAAEALRGLARGIYLVGARKVYVNQ